MRNRVVFIVESGWRGMREASLPILQSGAKVDMIIKGALGEDMIDVISKPKGLRLMPVSRMGFAAKVSGYLIAHKVAMDIKGVIVSKKRTKDWVKLFGYKVKILIETKDGYRFSETGGA